MRDLDEMIDWHRQHRNDPTIQQAVWSWLLRNEMGNLTEAAKRIPEEFVVFMEGLMDMEEQIPRKDTEWVSGHALRDGIE